MSKIEWTDKTWNPVTGCTKVSQGCKNCYAERIYERFNGKGSFRNVICHQDRIDNPMRWKKPVRVFVNSMSDLFHEDVPFSFIHDVFNTIAACPQHTFQVLTKRPRRAIEYLRWFQRGGRYKFTMGKNLWIGVSIEDQETANERIPLLLQLPAAVRFLSCEPLLGRVDIANDAINGQINKMGMNAAMSTGIDWVIAGGESGPGARPMHPDWVRHLRDQCSTISAAFFFKQWGEWRQYSHLMDDNKKPLGMFQDGIFRHGNVVWDHRKESVCMSRVGKKEAGRLLDGVLHNEFPRPADKIPSSDEVAEEDPDFFCGGFDY